MVFSRIITSCDENPNYLQFWPLISYVWKKKFGLTVTLGFLTNRLYDDELVRKMQKYGDVVIFPILECDLGNQAKVIRMYLASIFENDINLIVDIDLAPLNLDNYITELNNYNYSIKSDFLISYGANAYLESKESGKFPMNFLLGNGKTFMKVVNPENTSFSDLVLKKWSDNAQGLAAEPVLDYKECISQPHSVFSDESLIRYLCIKYNVKVIDIPRRLAHTGSPLFVKPFYDRIDRITGSISSSFGRPHSEGIVIYSKEIAKLFSSYGRDGSFTPGTEIVDVHFLRPLRNHINKYTWFLEYIKFDKSTLF